MVSLYQVKLNSAEFIPLGYLNGYTSTSAATGVSADGRVVVGASYDASSNSVPFRWTPENGMQSIGTLGGSTAAWGVSGDGTKITGNNGVDGFIWTQATGIQNISKPAGHNQTMPMAISLDGSTLVGYGNSDSFRWTVGNGFETVGLVNAQGVSSDGQVVVGSFNSTASYWTNASGSISLGTLSGGTASFARGISDDGKVIVGSSGVTGGNTHAFRWSQADGIQDIVGLSGFTSSVALAASSDGQMIIGYSSKGAVDSQTAFVWTKEYGIIDLSKFLQDQGNATISSWTGLNIPRDITGDNITGYNIAGVGTSNGQRQAFLLRGFTVPEPATYIMCLIIVGMLYGIYQLRNQHDQLRLLNQNGMQK